MELLKAEAQEVSLEEILQARQIRVERQDKLATDGKGLICFTMNIAGPYKNSTIIKKAFDEGVLRIRQLLCWNSIGIAKFEQYIEKTGCEAYFLAECEPYRLKNLIVQIEDGFALGRLYDIDIIKPDGDKISRGDIGKASRKCLICGSDGAGCARSREHSAEQLLQHTVQMICQFFNVNYTKHIAENTVKSLLYEVSVTPKPGLVDRKDNGAHSDMDFFTFVNSSCTLFDYFESCTAKAIELCDETPQKVFESIRYIGRVAEQKMYDATGGINTHKGAIFSLGIMCAALGYIYANETEKTVDNILDLCAKMAGGAIADFDAIDTPKTFGEELFCQMKLTGIRGQAAAGFPSVKNIAYPVLCSQLKAGKSINDGGALALIQLLAQVEDTNIIKRSSVKTLHQIQQRIKEQIKTESKDYIEELSQLNEKFVRLNISPGGCADLLSIAFMLYFTLHE